MQLLKVIRNEDIGFKRKSVKYKVRKAARAVLFDKDKTALLFVFKHNYHKIPGGGVKSYEDIKIALSREILEETGCTAEIKEEIGVIKSGRKTTEFWVSVATIITAIVGPLLFEKLPADWSVIASAFIAGLYAVSRGLAKRS